MLIGDQFDFGGKKRLQWTVGDVSSYESGVNILVLIVAYFNGPSGR